MELPPYSPLPPQCVQVTPIQQVNVEGLPIIRFDKDEGNQRHCTDTGPLITFVSFLSLASYIAILSLYYGSIRRVTHAVNSNGGICGSSHSSLADFNYLYYPLDPTSSYPRLLASARKCIAACPTQADVQGRRVIPITRTQIERSARGTSSTLLEYTVNTPVYATVPIAGRLCVPLSTSLTNQLTNQILGSPTLVYRSIVGSLLTSSWLIIAAILASFCIGIFHTWLLKTMPRLAILVATGTCVWVGFVLGASLITFSSRSMTSVEVCSEKVTHTLWIPKIPVESTLAMLIGIILVLGALALLVLVFVYKELLQIICRVNETVGDILAARPNGGMMGSPSVVSAGVGALSLVWVCVFALLSGASTNSGTPQALSGHRNGSALIFSLERNDQLPVWAFFSILFWIIVGFWVFEFLLSLLKFSVCYTATMWYFVAEPDAFSAPHPIRLTPSIVSLWIGLLSHAGSFSMAGILFGLTRPLRAIMSWVNARYTRNGQSGGNFAARVTDALTSNGFVEMAVASSVLTDSLSAAEHRASPRNSVTGRLIGAAYLGATLTVVSTALVNGLIIFSVLTQNPDYAVPTSKSFVPSPLFPTIVSVILSMMVLAPHIECWTALADALLYCYLLESEMGGGGLDEDPATKLHAPLPLRDLICEELDLWHGRI